MGGVDGLYLPRAPRVGKLRPSTNPELVKTRSFRQAAFTSAGFVGLLFVLEAIDRSLQITRGLTLDGMGILPRTVVGLQGILFAPLLHANTAHLLANSLPLLVLLTLLYWDRHYHPWTTMVTVWVAAGLGTWLIGRGGTFHIGASSVVFGLAAYLIVSGFLMKSWRSAFVSLFVFVVFGGIFYGVLPQPGPISWEGHLCGSVAGVLAAGRNHA